MSKKLKRDAKKLASKGRYGDKHLLHVTDDELKLLVSAGVVTINPKTGLPEAFNLGHVLSSAWHGVEHVAGPLIGGTLGFLAGGPIGAAFGAGLGEKAVGGSWNQALVAGALGFGGGELAGGFGVPATAAGVGTGTAATAAPAAAATGGTAAAGTMAAQDAAVAQLAASAAPADLGMVNLPAITDPVAQSVLATGSPSILAAPASMVNLPSAGVGVAAPAAGVGVGAEQAPAPVQDLSKPYKAPSFGDYFPSPSSVVTSLTGSGAAGNAMDYVSGLLGTKGGASGIGTIFDIGTGLYGLDQAAQMRRLAQQAMQIQDPFGPYRAQYAKQLADLSANPGLVTQTPGYAAGLEAVNRGLAASGYIGSGNQMAALQKYGGDIYQHEMARLSGLAGASISPVAAGQSLLTGNIAGTELAGQSLNRMAYGLSRP